MFFTRAWLSIEWASQLLRQVGWGVIMVGKPIKADRYKKIPKSKIGH